ncbi:sigma-70 family RNA polymerase sigma factor [Nodosilinea sp. FACHB-131]|uniref:sigma-70 family RNA polymerase sigma factor n=1 Tax=Cyanophyceae TaxID=3028117 RepID=UPI0016850055|nr:sigma-70 family RNA polymerase sigma factor [Nodosilinea sp. FACHB-131]MBD1874129.1 sigma-70 family RNA polymerase sigma factor [Nodosilinea sp. FACHB-131]
MTNATNTPPKQPADQGPGHELVYEFVTAVSYLLMPDEFKGTALYKFLIRFARQWHIANIDLDDVVIEGIKRGVEYILRHNLPIKKPEVWLRQVCLNILRSKVDATIKDERKVAMATQLAQHSKSPLIESELIEQLECLEVALNRLSKADQALIRMKFIHHKTYEQIRQHYKYIAESEEVIVPSAQTLRKRESRALERLRKVFLELYEGGANKFH